MNKKDLFKLDVISNIKEDIIERNTKKRAELIEAMSKRQAKRKKIGAVIAIAATLAVILSLMAAVIIPLMTVDKNVPVYTGMTASHTNGSSASIDLSDVKLLSSSEVGNTAAVGTRDQTKKTVNDIIVNDGLGKIYSAKTNEDVFITVHFNNPDRYKIMSFVLNGVHYADYMFEYGSDYENVIVKVDSGSVEGIINFTIDAIQYADKDTLKYVIMQGDPTLSIAVYNEISTAVEVTNEFVGTGSVSFDINVTNQSLGNGKLYAVVADGEAIIVKKEIQNGQRSVTLDGLKEGTDYRYAIIAEFYLQGDIGYYSYVIFEKEFRTERAISFENVNTGFYEVSFKIVWKEDFNGNKTLTALTLYRGNTKVKDIDFESTHISGLDSDTEYTLVAKYINGNEENSVSVDFKTNAKLVYYTVNHYVENLENSHYTLKETETLTATENTSVTPDTKKYTGFETPANQIATVLPDGSLVVDYYYTRNSYTITFVTNGGDAILTQTLKYEAEIPTLPNAVRDSDTFGGWFTDAKLTTAFTIQKMGSSNITLYAYWEGETKPGSFTYSGSSEIKITKFTGTEWDVVIPEYIAGKPVKTIGIKAFENSEIVSVVIPDTVTRLENLVFNFCYDLEHVTMGSGVKYIGDYIFNGVNDGANYILNIYITDLEAWCNISHGKRDNTQKNLYLNGELLEELIIPENITKIGDRTFDNIKSLKSVIIHDGVTSIGSSAFSVCDGLVSVTIGNGVTSIGSSAFSCCVGLTSITIPDNVTSIGDSAFYSCRRLASVTIGNGVTSIGDEAFYDCYYLSSLTIGKGVQRIGKSAFYCCRNLSTVQFEGTKGEWENISKGTNWRKSANIYIINCTDGDIIVE